MKDILEACSTRVLLTIAILDTGPGIYSNHQWAPSEYLADYNWSRREDLNTPSADYGSAALALSYTGLSISRSTLMFAGSRGGATLTASERP